MAFSQLYCLLREEESFDIDKKFLIKNTEINFIQEITGLFIKQITNLQGSSQ